MIVYQHTDEIIGKSFTETGPDNGYDWQHAWPAVDRDGIIRAVLLGDSISETAILLRYEDGTFVVTDGEHGFDAVDYYSY